MYVRVVFLFIFFYGHRATINYQRRYVVLLHEKYFNNSDDNSSDGGLVFDSNNNQISLLYILTGRVVMYPNLYRPTSKIICFSFFIIIIFFLMRKNDF